MKLRKWTIMKVERSVKFEESVVLSVVINDESEQVAAMGQIRGGKERRQALRADHD
jgi:streptomycin 6-kinase